MYTNKRISFLAWKTYVKLWKNPPSLKIEIISSNLNLEKGHNVKIIQPTIIYRTGKVIPYGRKLHCQKCGADKWNLFKRIGPEKRKCWMCIPRIES